MPLDEKRIEDLKNLQYENICLFNHLFHLFEIDYENFINEIDEQIKIKNHEKIFEMVHYMKSSCINIGAIDPGQICSVICKDIEKGNPIGIEQIEDLKYSIKESIEELKEFLKSQN